MKKESKWNKIVTVDVDYLTEYISVRLGYFKPAVSSQEEKFKNHPHISLEDVKKLRSERPKKVKVQGRIEQNGTIKTFIPKLNKGNVTIIW